MVFTKASISVTIANRLGWGFKQTTKLKYYTSIEILSKLNNIRIFFLIRAGSLEKHASIYIFEKLQKHT